MSQLLYLFWKHQLHVTFSKVFGLILHVRKALSVSCILLSSNAPSITFDFSSLFPLPKRQKTKHLQFNTHFNPKLHSRFAFLPEYIIYPLSCCINITVLIVFYQMNAALVSIKDFRSQTFECLTMATIIVIIVIMRICQSTMSHSKSRDMGLIPRLKKYLESKSLCI